MPTIERATSGLIAGMRTVGSPLLRRRRRVACRLVAEVRRRVAIAQTSTTTGKTIGRRFVCSYR